MISEDQALCCPLCCLNLDWPSVSSFRFHEHASAEWQLRFRLQVTHQSLIKMKEVNSDLIMRKLFLCGLKLKYRVASSNYMCPMISSTVVNTAAKVLCQSCIFMQTLISLSCQNCQVLSFNFHPLMKNSMHKIVKTKFLWMPITL